MDKPSMNGVLEYIKSRKDKDSGGQVASESRSASSPQSHEDAPGGDGTRLPYGQDESDESPDDADHVCESCGHKNKNAKSEGDRLKRASGNFETKEP